MELFGKLLPETNSTYSTFLDNNLFFKYYNFFGNRKRKICYLDTCVLIVPFNSAKKFYVIRVIFGSFHYNMTAITDLGLRIMPPHYVQCNMPSPHVMWAVLDNFCQWAWIGAEWSLHVWDAQLLSHRGSALNWAQTESRGSKVSQHRKRVRLVGNEQLVSRLPRKKRLHWDAFGFRSRSKVHTPPTCPTCCHGCQPSAEGRQSPASFSVSRAPQTRLGSD